jgi:hypothetical protein
MRCSSCDFENTAGKKFCIRCGAALSAHCPKCGSENLPEASFCGDCGASLEKGSAAPTLARIRGRTSLLLVSTSLTVQNLHSTNRYDERTRSLGLSAWSLLRLVFRRDISIRSEPAIDAPGPRAGFPKREP